MADIPDERLREIAADEDDYAEARSMAAELLAARETIRSKNRLLPSLIAEGIVMERERAEKAEAELLAARAQLHADDQRAWEALGRPEGTYETTNVQRLCAEVDRLRADLREALALLRDNAEVRMWVFRADADAKAVANWVRERDALLAKHKETPDA